MTESTAIKLNSLILRERMHQITSHIPSPEPDDNTDLSRRKFLTSVALVTMSSTVAISIPTANASAKHQVENETFEPATYNTNFPWLGP